MNLAINNILTAVFTLFVVLFPFMYKGQSKETLSNAATTLGILGTFMGILVGLMGFDPSDIANSVPTLLSGLKTAFITSVAGIIVSLLIKFYPATFKIEADMISEDSDEMNKAVLKHLESMAKNLDKISQNIGGDGDSSVLNQMILMRTSLNDKLSDLSLSFKDFAEKQSENNIKALEEALNNLVKDFNEKLINEFGENFKALDKSVQKMLDWQIEYKNQVDENTNLLKELTKNTEVSVKNLNDVVQSTGIFTELSEKLNYQLKAIGIGLDGFEKLSESAKSGFPLIKENLENIITEISTMNKSISQEIQANNEQYISTLENHRDRLFKQIEEKLEQIDKGLEEELNKSLNSLGNSLAALSGKFVEDYTPLTEKLQKLVQQGNNY
jgi:biopolymer transport protein ExbB/TolQ